MKLNKELLKQVQASSEVAPGNIYPAKGGKRTPGTDFWMVLACSDNGAHCIGFNANGEPVSTTSYLKGALRERPLIGKVDLSGVTLGVKNDS